MADFSYLSKLQPNRERTSRFTLADLDGCPVLIVRIASETNKPYFKAALADQLARSRSTSRRNATQVANAVAAEREMDRKLYPKHVVVGWEGVTDASGAVVPFNEENCTGFLAALPDFIIDKVRAHCIEPGNFVDAMPEAEDVAKT